MNKLSRQELMSLEQYAERRQQFRQQVMAHKRQRRVSLGEHAQLYFEDRLTIQYQIQEMLRVERIFESSGIQDELDAYNPLIPDGHNWKATFMLEYADEHQRRQQLSQLTGVEHRIWVQVEGFEPVFAIADEDLERSAANKTSSVHFLRFELTSAQRQAVKRGDGFHFGVSHPQLQLDSGTLPEAVRQSLAEDLLAPTLN